MRNLILLLVLANLLVLAWQRWIVPPPAADALALQAVREPELVLLKSTIDSGQAVAAYSGSAACVRIGPFTDAEAAADGAAVLRARGLAPSSQVEAAEVWVGHWVQVPGLQGRQAAVKAREALVAAGVQDAYVVQDSPGYKISLGVFRERARAERVARLARGAGFTVDTTDRVRAGEEHWLVLPATNGAVPGLQELAPGGDRILRSEPAACPGG
ncbi:MAG: hypothetical protein ACR2QB_11735 [Gammaproteobacteria bacterium]